MLADVLHHFTCVCAHTFVTKEEVNISFHRIRLQVYSWAVKGDARFWDVDVSHVPRSLGVSTANIEASRAWLRANRKRLPSTRPVVDSGAVDVVV